MPRAGAKTLNSTRGSGGIKSSGRASKSQPKTQREATSTLAPNEFKKVVDELFDMADVDQGGSIGYSEFIRHHQRIMQKAATETALTSMPSSLEMEKEFRHYDTDKNQCLDKEEFRSYMDSLLSVVGKRMFVELCESLAEEERQRVKSIQSGYDRRPTERLLDQARAANYYKGPMQQAAMNFLQEKADPNFTDSSGSHALLYAVGKAEAPFIQKLIMMRANPALHNKDMECAAFKAAQHRDIETLRVLLLPDCNALPEMTDEQSDNKIKTSERLVLEMGKLTAAEVKNMLKMRADINFKSSSGWTPLTAAVFWGKQDNAEVLLKVGTSGTSGKLRIESRNGKGRAALHVAARKGRSEIVPLILSSRGDPNVQDSDGWTPLHHAAFNGMDDVVQALIYGQAHVNIMGKGGLTPWAVSKLPSKAGSLTEETIKMLEPSENVNFAKAIIPVLKDDSLRPYDKLHQLLCIKGVNQSPQNLRLAEQFFDPRMGPNKIRLSKMWSGLAKPLLARLRTGYTDLEPPGQHQTEDARHDRQVEIQQRQREQKHFLLQWLQDTKGPKVTTEWKHNNREVYAAELHALLQEELQLFEKELESIYAKLKEKDGGPELISLPAEQVLKPGYISQLCAHPIQLWLEGLDPAGAFEALRMLQACSMGKDEEDSLVSFAELFLLRDEFLTGDLFWQNIYKLWLTNYAKVGDADFHKKMAGIVERFNEVHHGVAVRYRKGPVKSFDTMKAREDKLGQVTSETYEGRTVASKMLDIIRGSFTVPDARSALFLLNDFLIPLSGSLSVVKITNNFNAQAVTQKGYRHIELDILFNGGLRAGVCGRDVNFQFALIAEIQIVLEEFIAVKRRRHLLDKCSRGEFDWDDDNDITQSQAELGAQLARRSSLFEDDED